MEGQTNLFYYIIHEWFEWNRIYHLLRYEANGKKYKYSKCYFCDSKVELQMHHIIPLSKGGANHKENMIEVCLLCHCRLHKFRIGLMNNKLNRKAKLFGFSDIGEVKTFFV